MSLLNEDLAYYDSGSSCGRGASFGPLNSGTDSSCQKSAAKLLAHVSPSRVLGSFGCQVMPALLRT